MSSSMELFVLAAVLHLFALLGVGALLLIVFRSEDSKLPPQRRTDGDDDGGGGGGTKPRSSPPDPSIGGPPLPHSLPGRARMREPGRLADLLPRRYRRPAHRPNTPRVPTPR